MPRTYIYALCKYRKYHKRVHTNERPYKVINVVFANQRLNVLVREQTTCLYI